MPRFSLLMLCAASLLAPVSFAGAQPRPLSAAQRSALQNTYRARVNAVTSEMEPILTRLTAAFATLSHAPARRRVSGEVPEPSAANLRARGVLLDEAGKLRPQLRRLRALTPVPRSLKKADDDLIDAAVELDHTLDVMVVYAPAPNEELESRAGKLLRKGLTDLDAGLMKLARATDASVRAKTYVSD